MPLKRARLRISDYNQKRQSKLRSQERKIRMVSLSLTSMVDMFAILTIFLLTNATTVTQWIELGQGITLPQAKLTEPPHNAATIQVSKDMIFGGNQPIIATNKILPGQDTIGQIATWLTQGRKAKKEEQRGYINLVAHEKVSFGLIKRIITTCQESGFKNVNLAVQPK